MAEARDLSRCLIERAEVDDLPAIVAMLADDPLGATRETPTTGDSAADGAAPAACYQSAFAAIEADANQLLVVVRAGPGAPAIGCLQLSFIPGLARSGAWRGQIEAVRIARDWRDQGLGRVMFEWAITRCRERGCALVQLTTDRSRDDAQRFYASLGFVATHLGMKLDLARPAT